MNKRGPKPKPWRERFKKNPETGCWEWLGDKVGRGYGHFCLDGKTVRAHRYSYARYYGPFDVNKFVLHHCDNPGCVNPEHLYLGDHKQNMKDMADRNRAYSPSKDFLEKHGVDGVTINMFRRRVHRLGWNRLEAATTPPLKTGVGRGQTVRKG